MKTSDEIARSKHDYYVRNKANWKKYNKTAYDKSPERNALSCAKWRAKNRQKLCDRQREWALNNKEWIDNYKRDYHKRTLVRQREYRAGYREKNRERIRAYARNYNRLRAERDENFRIRLSLSWRIRDALRKCGARKSASVMKLIGCDVEFLKGFLEARFKEQMTWNNYGKWHVDHRIPCAEFDLRDPAQQRQCFHYSNLQPLWGKENLSKGAKRPALHQAELI